MAIVACVFVGALIPTIGFGHGLFLYDSTQDVHLDPIAFIHRLLLTWTPDYFLGMHAGFMQGYLSPYAFAYGLLAVLHVPAMLAQRMVMFAIYASIIVSTFISLRYITPRMHELGRLIASIAACWNIYVAFNSHGSSVMLLAYAAMPAFVGSFAAYIDGKISLARACSIVGLLSIFATGTNPPLLAIDACVVIMFGIVATTSARERVVAAKRFAQLAVAGGIMALVVNLYWIVPFVDYFHTVWLGGVLSESTAMHNAATSFANTLRGFGQWAIFVGDDDGPYYLWAASYAGVTLYSIATWLLVALAFLGLCYRRNAGRGQTFLLLCCACSLPLVVGYYTGPLGQAITSPVYGWLFTKVPYFQMFRSAYKWESAVVFSMSGLLGGFVSGALGSSWTIVKFRADVMRRAAAGAAALLVAVSFLPVAMNGMNPPEPDSLPAWFHETADALPATLDSRAALMPSQYLEQFLWGTPSYFVESSLSRRPLLFGYLGSAPSEDSDQWLHRLYREARAGDPDAADAFRLLGNQYVVQRDDFRMFQDFAFPGEDVLTSATQAHDIASRVLAAKPSERYGPVRIYGLGGARPTAFVGKVGIIAPVPNDNVAAYYDASAMKNGVLFIGSNNLSNSDIEQLLRAGAILDRRPSALRMLATSILLKHVTQAYLRSSSTFTLPVPKRDRYKIVINAVGWSGASPIAASIDRAPTQACKTVERDWNDCGDVTLTRGTHSIALSDPVPLGARVALVPLNALVAETRALQSMSATQQGFAYVDTAVSKQFTINSKNAGLLESTRPYSWSTELPQTVGLKAPDPEHGFRIQTPENLRWNELPVIPARGTATSNQLWLPRSDYAQPSTYDWNRGLAQSWLLLGPVSHFSVPLPSTHAANVTIRFRAGFLNSQQRVIVRVGGVRYYDAEVQGGPVTTSRRVTIASAVGNVTSFTVRAQLRPGFNDISIHVEARTRPADAFSDGTDGASSGSMAVTAAMPGVPTVTVASAGVTPETISSPAVFLASVRLPSARLWGAPHLEGRLQALPFGSRAFIVLQTVDDTAKRSSFVAHEITSDGTFDVALADMLPNSFSDTNETVANCWIVANAPLFSRRGDPRVLDLAYTSTFRSYTQSGEYLLSKASVDGVNPMTVTKTANAITVRFPSGTRAKTLRVMLPPLQSHEHPLTVLQVRGFSESLRNRAHVLYRRNAVWHLLGSDRSPPLAPTACHAATAFAVNWGEVTREDVINGVLSVERGAMPLSLTAGCPSDARHFGIATAAQGDAVTAVIVPLRGAGDVRVVDGTGIRSSRNSGEVTVPTGELRAGDAVAIIVDFDGAQNVRTQREFTLYAPLRLESNDVLAPDSANGMEALGDRTTLSGSTTAPWLRGAIVVGRSHVGDVSGISLDRISPLRLRATAREEISSPSILVLSESFHPLWTATLNGRPLLHVEVDGFANGWLVPPLKEGDTIEASFAGQRRFVIALTLSLIALAGMIVAILVRRVRKGAA